MKLKASEPIDFETEPRFRLGEKIESLTAQVEECKTLAQAAVPPTRELQGLAVAVSELKTVLGGAGKVKKKRAPWGSKSGKNKAKE